MSRWAGGGVYTRTQRRTHYTVCHGRFQPARMRCDALSTHAANTQQTRSAQYELSLLLLPPISQLVLRYVERVEGGQGFEVFDLPNLVVRHVKTSGFNVKGIIMTWFYEMGLRECCCVRGMHSKRCLHTNFSQQLTNTSHHRTVACSSVHRYSSSIHYTGYTHSHKYFFRVPYLTY